MNHIPSDDYEEEEDQEDYKQAHLEVIKLLLSYVKTGKTLQGINYTTEQGLSPFQMAMMALDPMMLKLLLDTQPDYARSRRPWANHSEFIAYGHSERPVYKRMLECFNLFQKYGRSLLTEDFEGVRFGEVAVWLDQVPPVMKMLRAMTPPQQKKALRKCSLKGRTNLFAFICYSRTTTPEDINYCLDNGADPGIVFDYNGIKRTALHYLTQNKILR